MTGVSGNNTFSFCYSSPPVIPENFGTPSPPVIPENFGMFPFPVIPENFGTQWRNLSGIHTSDKPEIRSVKLRQEKRRTKIVLA